MSREDIHSGAEALEQRRQSSFVPGLQEQMASAAVRRRGREDAMRALLPGEMAWNQPDNWKNLLVPTDIPPLYAGDSALSHHFADGAGAAPQPPHGERGAILPSREFREAAQPVPLALAYGRAGPTEAARAPRQTGSPAQPQSPESEYVRSLPDWAQRFLRSSSAGTPAMGVAKDISSLPQPDHAVTWTAPDYRPPQAAIAYREKGGGGSPQTRQEVRVSDAEIQRTADRVYRMIEERIRRERRRLGL